MKIKEKKLNKFALPLKLQHFSEPNGEPKEPEEPTVTGGTEPKEVPAEKTFTQAELDEIIAKRIERERKKFEGYDELKEKATQYEKEAEERRLAELSEKERAEELAKKYEQEKAELAEKLDEFKAQVEREKIRNAFITKAQAVNIAYIDDALALADLSTVSVGEDGVKGIDEVIATLVESKPFLLTQQAPKQPKQIGDSSNPGGSDNQKTAEQLLKEAAEKAKSSGRLEDMAAYQALKRELGL